MKSYMLIAAAVYFFVVLPIKRLTELRARRRAAGDTAEEASLPSDELITLREIRDLLSESQRS